MKYIGPILCLLMLAFIVICFTRIARLVSNVPKGAVVEKYFAANDIDCPTGIRYRMPDGSTIYPEGNR